MLPDCVKPQLSNAGLRRGMCKASTFQCGSEAGQEVISFEAADIFEVRHPAQSGWLDELGRLKGGRPINPSVMLKRAFVP
jgi:hypothetical protein